MKTAVEERQPEFSRPGTLTAPRVGQFMGVQFDKIRTYENGRTLRIVTYQAYNALGLIGSELNGVAVLDEDNKRVITDGLGQIDSGYFGVSRQAWDLAWELYTGTWEQVCEIVNQSTRSRYELS